MKKYKAKIINGSCIGSGRGVKLSLFRNSGSFAKIATGMRAIITFFITNLLIRNNPINERARKGTITVFALSNNKIESEIKYLPNGG